ncbi:hypothetical protein DSO57_1007903 [Entomophthora muscae]|uniref:Uncharacterized protein n=1 Tax=Entomophthora muscae TaxID=34485 RepID=A0ACC2T827_9FUNG|nr:hypothetical protein DSO57_1007903 [Entomophthora muscae]
MHFLLTLVASVVRASSDGPTLKPTHVVAGQLTIISLTLKGSFDCTNQGFPFLRLKVLDQAVAQGAYILPSDESYNYPPEKDPKTQPGFGKLITYHRAQEKTTEINAKFEYYDPSENNGAHLKMDLFCDTETKKV